MSATDEPLLGGTRLRCDTCGETICRNFGTNPPRSLDRDGYCWDTCPNCGPGAKMFEVEIVTDGGQLRGDQRRFDDPRWDKVQTALGEFSPGGRDD